MYIKTNCNIKKLDGITYKIAEIITHIFKNKYGIEMQIKEPNDIMIKNKKVGGILTETKINGETVKEIVIRNRDKHKQNKLHRRYKTNCNINKKRIWNKCRCKRNHSRIL